jgi:hypothetical protein
MAEREINGKWITPQERSTLYVEFNRDKLVQLDAKTQAEIEDIHIKNGSLTLNEKRAIHNQSAVDGGENPLVPINYTTLSKLVAPPAPPMEPPTPPTPSEPPTMNRSLQAATNAIQAPPTKPQAEVDLGALRAIQAEAATLLGADISQAVGAAARAVEAHYGLTGEPLKAFGAAYAASASKRVVVGNEAYEANRLTNALNLEALRIAYGVKTRAKWVGGKFNEQAKAVGDVWEGVIKHPPLSAEATDNFLIRGE